jgi:hypothetical protein
MIVTRAWPACPATCHPRSTCLRRCQDDGAFDRFAMHVRELWETGREV